ncbi:MAG TPA: DUF3800 domain-containing protein [Candidatus Portnoybacteria bacterium]|nr:DUF3800 domain-containing protein [Candidatus Portnoybacteria bacterium]
MIKPKRDFIFIDESGEPGQKTPYYIEGLLHITDETLRKIDVHLGALRYFGNIRNELKSTRLNQIQREKLSDILKYLMKDNTFIAATAVFVNKKKYTGNYLEDKIKIPKNATKFRHFVMRRLLEFHFKNYHPQSSEIEIIVDRFHSDEFKEQQMRNYLRKLSSLKILPRFLHIIQADSRYVELLQVADWIAGSIKEKFFIHPEREYNDLFKYIKVREIIKD